MRKVEALFRPERLEPVMEELGELGYPGVTITEVKGHGKQKGVTHMWRGSEYRVEFLPKIKLEVVVLDEDLGKVVNAVVRSARTGSIGDGKIFIYNVDDAIRIRTGESGFQAI
ncbi:MAG: transcriptional regulator [Actinobacteria bacterium RBG_19FT_COMBO_54_7]|uniref:Transcriptional regulator n=1 Tax=Candidatus Solincola sediminis TaxID=1797199 RepID=A0A1F2WMD8_9ACTN|nr:MAG: transcriptional regulator [Candidatus Solincola sediminis]OFW61372.1 MAG: transcriptional regulator [Candidatus Solincola sediminis]OFW68890.1 MAG: transcriptional regulator [Actinobacteria bacterium RBG_19FT_COMBO_54_7]